MTLITAKNLTKDYGSYRVFEQVSFQVNEGDKIGLIGRNGEGKTTLVKLITGELTTDEGHLDRNKSISIGYLSQEPDFNSHATLFDEMKTVFSDLLGIQTKITQLEGAMSKTTDEQKLSDIFTKYGELRESFEQKGGYQIDRDIRSILKGLGFSEHEFEKPITHLSGGQKTRALLAQKLLQKPEILILDEPTNYLDLDGVDWLEGFLQNYSHSVIVITHDRYFLDKTVDNIWELTNQTLTYYKGNYSAFIHKKAAIQNKQLKDYKHQQHQIKKTQEFIRKNIAGQKTNQAQSRRKQLENMTTISKPDTDTEQMKLSFTQDHLSGKEVVTLSDVTKNIEGNNILPPMSFKVYRGEKIGIIGPNGSGKSTLLKIISGEYAASSGDVAFGSKVVTGYIDQEQNNLTRDFTLIDEMRKELPLTKEEDIRRILGRFIFQAEQMDKLVANLSGGEKVRLALAKMYIRNANLLLLDEPTNHLDITSREDLETALVDFPGTLIVVSHDRFLLDRVCNKIISFGSHPPDFFDGNYTKYQEKLMALEKEKQLQEKLQAEANKTNSQQQTNKQAKTNSNKQKKQQQSQISAEQLFAEIEKLEDQQTDLENQLADPDLYKDNQKAREVNLQYQEIRSQLEQKYSQLDELDEL